MPVHTRVLKKQKNRMSSWSRFSPKTATGEKRAEAVVVDLTRMFKQRSFMLEKGEDRLDRWAEHFDQSVNRSPAAERFWHAMADAALCPDSCFPMPL